MADAKGQSCLASWSKEITVAARGGAGPASNSRLRLVVEQARKASMPGTRWSAPSRRAPAPAPTPSATERVIYEGFAFTRWP